MPPVVYVETSSKENHNIDLAFKVVSEMACERNIVLNKPATPTVPAKRKSECVVS